MLPVLVISVLFRLLGVGLKWSVSRLSVIRILLRVRCLVISVLILGLLCGSRCGVTLIRSIRVLKWVKYRVSL